MTAFEHCLPSLPMPTTVERLFYDPVSIAFDPASLNDETDTPEEGVTLRDVWKDDLARTLWLAVKSRHITNQYFRRDCVEIAKELRANPPLAPAGLQLIPGVASYTNSFPVLRDQLWPYIVRVLIDEGRWGYRPQMWSSLEEKIEYLEKRLGEQGAAEAEAADEADAMREGAFVPYIIPKGVPPRQLRWAFRPREKRDEPHPWRHAMRNGYPYIGEDWKRYTKCSFCYKPWYDLIHIEGPVQI